MTAPDIVKQLVARFEEHRDAYRSGRYNETQLRREFLDPFFEALGWDIFNRQNYAEMYKDVIHVDSLEIEGENKAPDYAVRPGGHVIVATFPPDGPDRCSGLEVIRYNPESLHSGWQWL
jgi:hypothetical protein